MADSESPQPCEALAAEDRHASLRGAATQSKRHRATQPFQTPVLRCHVTLYRARGQTTDVREVRLLIATEKTRTIRGKLF